jgi:indolepyruvate ferredoxin oxidoreductase alpha subunit
MEKRLLSGNEAVAYGAWEAGVRVASGYPGTPSTEILETFAAMPNVYAEWAPNEKVAVDVAVGSAYAGQRAMATMKHVGLNVAADSFFYASMTGVEAGLLLVVADDPSMYSSQNEQDTRRYAKFARIPCLDPADSQEARDMVALGLEISERFDTPVLLRLTTRVSHSGGLVRLSGTADRKPREQSPTALEANRDPRYPRNPAKYVMVPANAYRRHPEIEERTRALADFAESFGPNRIESGDPQVGIVTCGVAYQYAKEVFPDASFLKLGMSYPVPRALVARFAAMVERLIVIEELDPCLEEEIKLMGIPCEGKNIFPIAHELSPQVVREAAVASGLVGRNPLVATEPQATPFAEVELPPRPPVLCPGCPHRPVFTILSKLRVPVNGDIGCYTLGLLPPLSALHTCGCMGAGIGVAHGADKAGDGERHVAVIGDSTFFHTGMPALLNVSYNKGQTVVIIMDNRITAMTGHQGNPGTGRTLQNEDTYEVRFAPLVRAMGLEHVTTVDPYRYKETEQAFKEALARDGPSVIITRRPCALLREVRRTYLPLRVDTSKCTACHTCIRTGCPALRKNPDAIYERTGRQKADIDPLLCTGCELCAQVCPTGAILFRSQVMEDANPKADKNPKAGESG